jgi:NADPH:quinone reductase
VRPAAERRLAFERLMTLASAGKVKVDVSRFRIDQAADVWSAQIGSPHSKVVVIF